MRRVLEYIFLCVVMVVASSCNRDEVITTQYPMGTIERLGLLKMDFLGLRTLTVIRDAVENIKRAHGVEIDIENIDMTGMRLCAVNTVKYSNLSNLFTLIT